MTHRPLTPTRRRLMLGTAGSAALASIGLRGSAMAQTATPSASPVAAPAVEAPDMTGVSYAFQVGSFNVTAVSDGANAGDFVQLIVFGGTPDDRVQEVIAESGVDPAQMVSQHTSPLIDTGSELVLVDTGSGSSGLPESGILIDNLRREGVQPGDIDVVILTHGHPDHIGGNLTPSGNPIYSNARYVMAQEEWDFWTNADLVREAAPSPEFAETFLAAVEANLSPLEGAIELIGYDEEIVPGITSVDAKGHTPGHMALLVESDGEQLWVMGDAALSPLDVPYPDLIGFPDTDPEQVVATRERLFAEIADANGWAAFNHFDPFPGVGHIVSDGDVWQWEPVEVATESEEG